MLQQDIARLLSETADLLEIDGAETFRISSFRRASRSLDDFTGDLQAWADEGKLTSIPGIGKGMAARIQEYLDTGRLEEHDSLKSKFPPGLLTLLDVPGMGPKKVSVIHRSLGVGNLTELRRVIESGELAELPGFGAASVRKIAEGITFLESSAARTPLGVALPLAETVLDRVRLIDGVVRAEIAGSLRRGCETIGDVDIVCETTEGRARDIVRTFTELQGVQRVLASGDTKGSITIELEQGRPLQIDLRVVPGESYGAALQYFTGSKEHNVRVREFAVRKGWRLNEYGLFDGESSIAGRTEADIYARLGLPMAPPEQREDRGELELDEKALQLVELADIRGDLHMHTMASDGRNTIEEMALAAKERGYDYIAICDHSKSSVIANGLSIERMWQHIEDVRAVDKKIKGIAVLAGCECDILADGSLDYPDDILAACDWVVASVHSGMSAAKSGKDGPTQRTLAAMENPFVCAIGHPTGRLINRRPAMELDMERVVQAAAESRTMLEINASWQRLDLKDIHVRQARAAGVTLVINTDAHSTDQLDQMRFGVITARRGGARKDDVANTGTLANLRKLIQEKRCKK